MTYVMVISTEKDSTVSLKRDVTDAEFPKVFFLALSLRGGCRIYCSK